MEFTLAVPPNAHPELVRLLANDAGNPDYTNNTFNLDDGVEVSASTTPPANTLWVTVTKNPKDIGADKIKERLAAQIRKVQTIADAEHRGEPSPVIAKHAQHPTPRTDYVK